MHFFQLINLPNLLTLINLFSGCVAVALVFNQRLEAAPYCLLVSLIADFLDGFAARFTKNTTDIGKQLDSLADMVSFGFLPAAIIFQLLYSLQQPDAVTGSHRLMYLYAAPAFVLTLFAALRLAKFNLDTRQSEGFIGLATPAVAIFVAGLVLIRQHHSYGLQSWIDRPAFLYAVVVVCSWLMVAELPMFSFKFKTFGWKGNELRYVFIIVSLISLATFTFAALSLIILLYLIISIGQKIISR